MSEISKQAPNKTNDDLSQINDDIDSLYKQYIQSIDSIRSKSRPKLEVPTNYTLASSAQSYNEKITNVNNPLESRVHAFYRMIGLPVVSPDNGYYNPGYTPNPGAVKSKRFKINSAYYEAKDLANFVYEREKQISNFEFLFSISLDELPLIVFSLLSKYLFPSAVTNPDSTNHLDIDPQKIKLDSRELNLFLIVNSNYVDQINAQIERFKTVFHPIKPFIVDPRIADAVDPDVNIICVPFLKDKDQTEIEENVFLKTPVIQDIIEQRLDDAALNKGFLKSIENILNNNTDNKATTDVDYQSLAVTVGGLLEESKITDSLKDFIKDTIAGVTNVQFREALKITRTIKILVRKLIIAQARLDKITSLIGWVPIPGPSGPGASYGWKLSEKFSGEQQSVDLKIKNLELQKEAAQIEAKKNENAGISASPFVRGDHSEDIKKYDQELKELKSKVASTAKKGFQELRIIEIIKGEVSGLGLIDILAMYYALWSMSIENLLYLLDDDAINRMVEYNPKFGSIPAVENRKKIATSSTEVLLALNELENRVYFMLNFADKYYEECLDIKTSNDSKE